MALTATYPGLHSRYRAVPCGRRTDGGTAGSVGSSSHDPEADAEADDDEDDEEEDDHDQEEEASSPSFNGAADNSE